MWSFSAYDSKISSPQDCIPYSPFTTLPPPNPSNSTRTQSNYLFCHPNFVPVVCSNFDCSVRSGGSVVTLTMGTALSGLKVCKLTAEESAVLSQPKYSDRSNSGERVLRDKCIIPIDMIDNYRVKISVFLYL